MMSFWMHFTYENPETGRTFVFVSEGDSEVVVPLERLDDRLVPFEDPQLFEELSEVFELAMADGEDEE